MPRERKSGFSESRQSDYAAEIREFLQRKRPHHERIKLGDGGRIVIPAAMREEMGVSPGDTLIAHVENGVLHVLSYKENLRRIQEDLAKYKKPGESVVDEFLAERSAMWDEDQE